MNEQNKSQIMIANIMLSHGSNDPRWTKSFENILVNTREHSPQKIFCLCFLETFRPSLNKTFNNLIDSYSKVSTTNTHPIFRSAGVHFNKDIKIMISGL